MAWKIFEFSISVDESLVVVMAASSSARANENAEISTFIFILYFLSKLLFSRVRVTIWNHIAYNKIFLKTLRVDINLDVSSCKTINSYSLPIIKAIQFKNWEIDFCDRIFWNKQNEHHSLLEPTPLIQNRINKCFWPINPFRETQFRS